MGVEFRVLLVSENVNYGLLIDMFCIMDIRDVGINIGLVDFVC